MILHKDIQAEALRASKPKLVPAKIIVDQLTNHVRVVSDLQLLYLFDGTKNPKKRVDETLRRLEVDGSVILNNVMVHPPLTLSTPIWTWAPGDKAPNPERIAWQLRSRWTHSPVRTLVATATMKAHRVNGARRLYRPPRPVEIAHDLNLTELYVRLCRHSPQKARDWIHEDTLWATQIATPFGKIPDAMIGGTAIDFGGSYSAAKIRQMHASYASEGRPYEIW